MSSKKWSLKEVPVLADKIIIVTGGNSGLGFESVKAFASYGAEVILACRSIEKGELAKSQILKEIPKAKIEIMSLDLMDLNSVRDFSDTFKSRYQQLDVLLNNAGIMMTPYRQTSDGFESQMGTNHLGHFALTGSLFELLIKTKDSRIVNVSSNAHKWGSMQFDNLLFENGKDYSPTSAYGRSKLSNLLFTYELDRKLKEHQIGTLSVAAHPGGSMTNLGKHLEDKLWYKLLLPLAGFFTHKPANGALPQIRASVDPNVKSGEYYGPNGLGEMKGDPVLVSSNPASHNLEDARKLWDISEKLTGITYKF